jgi:hypothetical protein
MSSKNISHASLKILSTIAFAVLISSCSESGFSTGSEVSKTTTNGNGSLGEVVTPPPSNPPPTPVTGDISPIEKLDYKAIISSSSGAVDNRFDGMNYIHFDKEAKEAVFTLPLYFEAEFQADLSITFKQYPDIRVSMVTITDEDDYILGNALEVRVPVSALIKGLNFVPGRLPNGESLRGFPKNEAPTTNVSFKIKGRQNLKLYIYLGVNNIGFFVESDWGGNVLDQIPLSIYIPAKNEAKTAIRGYFGFVAKGLSSKPGFYLSYKLPPEVSAFLESKLGVQ